MNKQTYLLFNLFRALLFGIMYTILETNVPISDYIPSMLYRIFYFIIFAFATVSSSVYLWVGNFFISMAIEDIMYWLIKNQLPFQYVWYYPVIDHIPIDDVIEVILTAIAYTYYLKNEDISKIPKSYPRLPKTVYVTNVNTTEETVIEGCGMWYAFTHGKTHDEYGMIILMIVGLTETFLGHFPYNIAGIITFAVAVAVFVDLWAHCFHH